MESFSTKEEYWINKMLKGEDHIIDGMSKSDYKFYDGYLSYIDLLIKYGNLRIPEEEYVPTKKVIKVNRLINKKVLDASNYVYSIFGGVYIVQQVVFVKAEHCEALLDKKVNDNPNISEEDLLISSFKTMTYEDGSRWCIFLVKSDFTKQWIGYSSKLWEYVYIYDDDECEIY